jgi:hypothetical protein
VLIRETLNEGDLLTADIASAVCDDCIHGPLYSRKDPRTPVPRGDFFRFSWKNSEGRKGSDRITGFG